MIWISLFAAEERKLVERLIMNISLFSWTPSDMPGIDSKVVSHHLAIHPSIKLVLQMKQKVGDEKRATIDEEVENYLT